MSSSSFDRLRAALVVCAVLAGTGWAEAQVSYRQPGTFPFDPELVDGVWIDALVSFRTRGTSMPLPGPESDDFGVTVTGAWRFLPRLEIGARTEWISRDFDAGRLGEPSGLGDLLGWAKYQLSDSGASSGSGQATWSVGGFASLPTGDEDDFFGTGDLDFGVFGAAGIPIAADGQIQLRVGARFNGDFDARTRAGRVRADGETSITAGFGVVYPTTSGVEVFAEFTLETERYDSGDSFAGVSGGGRWSVGGPWSLQATAGVGLADAAADLVLGFGAVYSR